MITTSTLPPKAAKARCTECGLLAPSPIVVAGSLRNARSGDLLGRCSDRTACALRARRAKNRAKEPTS